jgi:hypothetical protein
MIFNNTGLTGPPWKGVRMSWQVYTCEPFTVAVCMRCSSSDPQSPLFRMLRDVVRGCQHGVLLSTQCLLGTFTCAARGADLSPVLVLQPCSAERVPSAAAIWVGPIGNEADARDACDWIAAGRWDRTNLPERLRADRSLVRVSARN